MSEKPEVGLYIDGWRPEPAVREVAEQMIDILFDPHSDNIDCMMAVNTLLEAIDPVRLKDYVRLLGIELFGPETLPTSSPEDVAEKFDGFCTTCGFQVKSFEGLTECPNCGSKGVPCSYENQVNVTVNTHELRLLCVWAENWGNQITGCCLRDSGTIAASASQ